MKKLIAFSLIALFAGSVIANNIPQQANNNVAPQANKDKDKDHDKGHHRHHHRHHHERREQK